ncbi:MAG: cation:proton antiporter [Candidatus Pacearchaeota archaeon]|nr:cation:proton antiporter [Candidatus Pacearchaeota archaeon]
MEDLFIQLGIILFTAFIVSYIAREFKQPIVIGYIISGIIISPFIIEAGASKEIITIFSDFGIAFLLFIVGLHLNPKVIKEIGTASLLIGTGQIILTFLLTFLVSTQLLQFDLRTSFYVSIALTFSSTIIIMKLLSDKRQLDSLYGKISIGILIVQDLVAIGVLMFMSSLANGENFSTFAVRGLLGGSGAVVLLFLVGFFILPRFIKNIATSQELLFLFSICWCFLIAAIFIWLGFSLEIGALVAGIVLSISPYSTEISSKIRPLRDFFLIIFFIILGLNMDVKGMNDILLNAIILSIIALIFKPLILMSLCAVFGYTRRTNFLVGSTLAQISEFSLIVLGLGVTIGHISEKILSTMVLTSIITITLSAYFIIYSEATYKKLRNGLFLFEKKNIKRQRKIKKEYNAILFGYNRIGFSILQSLKKIRKHYLVVDYNPDTIANLTRYRIPCLYGDVGDNELLNELPLNKVELAVSTIPDFETNYLLIDTIKKVNPDAIIIVRAHSIEEALDLYKEGATYVLTPHFLGGEYIANMIKDIKVNEKEYLKEKNKHIKMLNKRMQKGHDHPHVERN